MRPTRPSFLRRKARIRFRTGEITIAEAADCSGPWPGSHSRPFRTTIWLVVDDRMSNQCVWHFAQRNGIAFMGVCLVSRSELAQIGDNKDAGGTNSTQFAWSWSRQRFLRWSGATELSRARVASSGIGWELRGILNLEARSTLIT